MIRMSAQSQLRLIDDLVGGREQFLRNRQPEHFRSGQIDDEIEFGRLLDWQFPWLRTMKNLIDVLGSALEHVAKVWTVRY
jgi:hypothetical protein